jgi:hypothetical protein
MPLIGEELRTILGMMPVRDRAGIARGTMADDAMKASAAADNGNAEGQALMQQGGPPRPAPQAPPQVKLPPMGGPGGPPPGDIQLPADVPTAFASGSGGGGSAALPAPTERVVAASPAAAPSRAVATASDAMVAAIEQRNRQAKMMQLVGSLGLIANAFNRNPQSQASTRSSLADMVGGGGGGGKGGSDLSDIKTISDMQRQEAADRAAAQTRTSTIGAMVAKGMRPEDAAVEYDNNLHTQRLGFTAEGAIADRQRADATRASLLQPAAVEEIMKQTGMPRFQVEAEIRSGDILKKIDPKELTAIADKQSETAERTQKTAITGADFGVRSEAMKSPDAIASRLSARLGREVSPDEVRLASATEDTWKTFIKETTQGGQVDIVGKDAEAAAKLATAAKTKAETAKETQAAMSFDEAKRDPVKFAEQYPQLDTPAKIAAALSNRPTYEEFTKGAVPNATQHLKEWEQDEMHRKQVGLPPRSLPAFAQSLQPKTIETPEEKASGEALTTQTKKFYEDRIKPTEAAEQGIRNSIHPSQDMWTPNLITGSGNMSVYEEKGRRMAANLLGYSDKATEDTQLFFNERRAKALEMRRAMPGAMSDGDREFLLEIAGNKDMSANTLRRLLTIQEKYARAQIANHNEEVDRRKAASPTTWKHLDYVPMPEPGRFIREDLATPYGQQRLQQLREHPENKKVLKAFEEDYGKGLAKHYLAGGE